MILHLGFSFLETVAMIQRFKKKKEVYKVSLIISFLSAANTWQYKQIPYFVKVKTDSKMGTHLTMHTFHGF